MKNLIKSRIFAFILGAIIFGSVGVIAANYAANTIDFTPKDTTWKKQDGSDIKTVQDALDDLYGNRINLDNLQLSNNYLLSRSMSTTVISNSINLTKGKYIVFISYVQAWNGGSEEPSYNEYDMPYNVSDGGKCTLIDGRQAVAVSSGTISNSYEKGKNKIGILLCDISNNSTISSNLENDLNSSIIPQSSIIIAMKLN